MRRILGSGRHPSGGPKPAGKRRETRSHRRLQFEFLESRRVLNGAPIALADTFSTGQHAVLVRSAPGLLTNDTDPDGDSLQVASIDTTGTKGLVAWSKTGSFAYDPNKKFASLMPGESASDIFSYTISDGKGGTATAQVTISVFGTNNPVANDDTYSTTEDSTLNVPAPGLLANDTDADLNDTLSVTAVNTTGTLGKVTRNANGSFSYAPNGKFERLQAGQTATDTFTYTVTDSFSGTDTGSVSISITGVNDAPLAAGDSYQTAKSGLLTVSLAQGLLANDTDPDTADVIEVTAVDTGGTQGTVSWNSDGSFTYDPAGKFAHLQAGQSATDVFTYTVADVVGGISSAQVTITLQGSNDLSVAADDTYSTDEVTTLSVTTGLGLLANDTSAAGKLTVIGVDEGGTLGDVVWNADGSFEYDTLGWFADLPAGASDQDVFTYTMRDENGTTDTATVVITVMGVNDAPRATNDAYSTDESTILSRSAPGLLVNDFDVDLGDVLAISSVNTTTLAGSLTWSPDGGFQYDPNGKFTNLGEGETAVERFSYVVSDGHGGTHTADVTITIQGVGAIVNDPPQTVDDSYSVAENVLLSISAPGLLANDTDPNGDAFQVVGVDLTGTLGQVNWGADGRFTYDPAGKFTGLAQGTTALDAFSYSVRDARGGTDTSTVTITVNGVNDVPIAADDVFATPENAVRSIEAPGVLANDTDPNGDALEVTGIATTGTLGAVSWSANGAMTYDPNGKFDHLMEGQTATDSFGYTLRDVHGGTAAGTVVVTIAGVNRENNQSPVATDDSYEGDRSTNLLIPPPGLLTNDTDPDGDALSVIALDKTGTKGLVVFQSNGSIAYNPFGKFDGLLPGQTAVDSFSYTISDGQGGTDSAIVRIHFSGGPGGDNQPPVAADDSYATDETTVLTIAAPGMLGNDTDADAGQTLAITAVNTSGTIGSVTWAADGSFQYDPAGHFASLQVGTTATDSFAYTVSDGLGGSDTALVTVTISGVNSAPVAVNDAYSTHKSLELIVRAPGVLANDSDSDVGDALSVVSINTTGTKGLVVKLDDGSIGYDPFDRFDDLATGETALDTFTYTVKDLLGATATATVTITVTNAGDGPLALTISDASLAEGDAGTSNLTFTVTLSAASTQTVTVNYATADGTAVQSTDYETRTGTLTFAPGVTSQTIHVPVIGDTLDEPDETLLVNLSAPINAVIGDSVGAGTLVDDDAPPTLSVNDVAIAEGNSGTSNLTFVVTLSQASGKSVSVSYATVNGTAVAGQDYQAVSGTLTFGPGETSRQVLVPVTGDTTFETDEAFQFALSSPVNSVVADGTEQGTISNDDARPSISIANAQVTEGNTGDAQLVFTITLSHATTETVSVAYATADGTASQTSGDYDALSGTVVFQPGGSLSQTIQVKVHGDTTEETDETLTVNLTNPVNTTITQTQATGTILDDDASHASLAGFVYLDVNASGVREARESGVAGVTVRLQGVVNSSTVNFSTVTAADGSYQFNDLRAGAYELTATQHTACLDGPESAGTLGGNVGADRISGISVARNAVGTGYNFGELGLKPQYISVQLFFASAMRTDEYLPTLMAKIAGTAAQGAASVAAATAFDASASRSEAGDDGNNSVVDTPSTEDDGTDPGEAEGASVLVTEVTPTAVEVALVAFSDAMAMVEAEGESLGPAQLPLQIQDAAESHTIGKAGETDYGVMPIRAGFTGSGEGELGSLSDVGHELQPTAGGSQTLPNWNSLDLWFMPVEDQSWIETRSPVAKEAVSLRDEALLAWLGEVETLGTGL